MKNIFRVLVIVAAFATGQVMAQSTDGFSVGGVGTFGGTAVNPVTENGWGSLDDYGRRVIAANTRILPMTPSSGRMPDLPMAVQPRGSMAQAVTRPPMTSCD